MKKVISVEERKCIGENEIRLARKLYPATQEGLRAAREEFVTPSMGFWYENPNFISCEQCNMDDERFPLFARQFASESEIPIGPIEP